MARGQLFRGLTTDAVSAIWASARSAPSTGPPPVRGAPGFLPRTPRGRFGATVRPVRRFRVPIRTLWGQTTRFGQSNHGPTRPRPRRAPPSAGRPRGAFSCCAKSACTAFGAGRDPAGRNRPIGYFSPPKTTPKPPGTTIFGRLYTIFYDLSYMLCFMHCMNHWWQFLINGDQP